MTDGWRDKRGRMTGLRAFPDLLHAVRFLALAAMLARALVPAGWMPALADGAVRVEVCSGFETFSVWIGRDGRVQDEAPDGEEPDHDGRSGAPCAFAGLLAPFVPGMAGDAGLTAPPPAALRLPAPVAASGRGLAAPPPPQTGPPLS